MDSTGVPNTESRNQHFVPKFYLQRFSVNRNKAEIKVYAFNAKRFIQTASIRCQAAGSFYYGKDGVTEKKFGILEGKWAEALRRIEITRVASNSSRLYFELLEFVVTTDVRNPKRKELNQTVIDENAGIMKLKIAGNQVLEIPSIYTPLAFKLIDDWVDKAKLKSVQHMLKKADFLIKVSSDLRLVLVVNETELPFVTCDYPIIFYNQLFEAKAEALNIGTAYASLGCQIFFPICDRFLLVFYDSKIYNLLDKGKRVLAMRDDVDQLNKLQVLNSISAVYGNERFTVPYLQSLLDERSVSVPKKSFAFPENKINMQLSFFKLSPFAIKLKIKPGTLPKRRKADQVIKVVDLMKKRRKRKFKK